MQEQLWLRLEELKKEFETGQGRLGELEMQLGNLQQTLLRISGAIQVLEELLVLGAASHQASVGDGPLVEVSSGSLNGRIAATA